MHISLYRLKIERLALAQRELPARLAFRLSHRNTIASEAGDLTRDAVKSCKHAAHCKLFICVFTLFKAREG